MAKSRKLAYLRLLAILAKSDQEGRVGPPEFSKKPGKAGKAGKERK